MAIDKKGVGDIPWYDWSIINIHVIDIIHYVNPFALTRIRWFDYPHIFLRVMLLQFLIMRIKIAELIRQYVCIRYKIKWRLSEFLLHPHHIVAETVLPGDLIGLREVVDLLELVQALVEVALARGGAPEDVPLVRLRVAEAVALEDWAKQLVVEAQHLIKELWILYVVRLLTVVATGWEVRMGWYHLVFFNIFEWNELVFTNSVSVIPIQTSRCRVRSPSWAIIEEPSICAVPLPPRRCLVEILVDPASRRHPGSRYPPSGRCGGGPVWVLFELTQLAKYLIELPLAFLLLDVALGYNKRALLIDEVARAHSPRDSTVDPVPLSFKVRLDLLQTVKGTHLLLGSRLGGRWGLVVGAAGAGTVVASHLL
jgi:hypothetical protein